MASFHDFDISTITGEQHSLADYAGKVVLAVNVASACGLTPQYAGLEQLQQTFGEQGFTVLGFPCNQFAGQEPGSDAEVCAFATERFDVTFPLTTKIEVNGDGAHPVYGFLRAEQPGEGDSDAITWNFEKFLIDRDGAVVARFSPMTTPEELAEVLPEYL